jgi:zinc transporter ZupT
MLEAFSWGFLAQSSLLLAGLLVCWVTVPTKVVGILGGFGAGAMIAAVSFDLLPEAHHELTDSLLVRAWGITRRRGTAVGFCLSVMNS